LCRYVKEAQHINKSLSALGDVISALQTQSGHVPYRNSKLTLLLQGALGQSGKALVFMHVSPTEGSTQETISTLNFAVRVSSVELGRASRNTEMAELANAR
jgi:kinesin family protein C2/C3